jgi:hypothetical protein
MTKIGQANGHSTLSGTHEMHWKVEHYAEVFSDSYIFTWKCEESYASCRAQMRAESSLSPQTSPHMSRTHHQHFAEQMIEELIKYQVYATPDFCQLFGIKGH